MINETLEAVRKLTDRGFVIHPLSAPNDNGNSPGKRPLLPGWQTLTHTPDDIGRHVTQGCNLGLVCGKVSGVMVLDFDHELFKDDIFHGIELNTLISGRTAGRGHVYFKYNPNLKASKHHDLGIEVLSDGNNAVVPPSIHNTGMPYKWLNPDMPIMDMGEIENRLNFLFKIEAEVKQILPKTRSCFRDVLKRRDSVDWHGAEGREFMLALCTDLKRAGANEDHVKMFSKLIYKEKYDEQRTLTEWRNIDPAKTWKCETLKAKLPGYIDPARCETCDKRQKSKKTEQHKDKTTEPQPEAEKIPEHIINRSLEILNNGNPLPFLMQEYQKNHVGDQITGKMLFAAIGTQAIINSSGIQPKLSAESGKGKSHAVASVLHLMPREYVLETSLSGKALFHIKNLKPGTIIFSDDTEPNTELQEIIKRSSTRFQEGTKHTISVKAGDGWDTKTTTIPPRIIWVLTSVNDNGSLEYLNRQLNLSVDESEDQDVKVMDFLLKKAETGEPDLPITDNVLVCREIIRDIKSKLLKVKIPFATRIIWNDSQNRRNLPQLLDLIKAFAVYDYRHRTQTEPDTIEANEEDFNIALSMYSTRAINQKLKLNDKELRVLSLMAKDIPYTIPELQELIGKSETTVLFTFHGRPGHAEGGLLNKVSALKFSRETEYLGESEISGDGEYEREYTKTKRSKARNTYTLTEDFKALTTYGQVACLKDGGKK